ncbi:MAG: hypothetical protein KKH61_21430 [Gammaproteobacteria bacterium]|uniref:Uncharacterized protein n=1 Tax=viral metagenome TaxID=1070528 RepID=A0A6H1ZAX2_9ZZZZ|nr:hypothetical protein [Gammaproteobacteria bacterium]
MANVNTNDNSKVSQIINGAMSAEKANGNRQRDLVLYMFEHEATFSKAQLVAFFKLKGADLTKYVNRTLSDLSAGFAETIGTIEVLKKEAANKDTSPTNKAKLLLQIEQLNSGVRAASALFKRSMYGVFHLRCHDAEDVVAARQSGALAFSIQKKDAEGKKSDKAKWIEVVMSGNALERAGRQDVVDAKIKPAAKQHAAGTATANPGIKGVVMATDVLGTFLSKSANKPMTDYPDDEEKALQSLMDKLLRSRFGNDKSGKIDPQDVLDYLEAADMIAKPKAKPQQQQQAAA